MLYFLAYSGLINALAALGFGLFVYLKNRSSVLNRSYAILSVSIAIWGLAYFFMPLASSAEQALLSFRMLQAGAILIAPSFLWFILALLELQAQFKKIIISAFTLSAVFLLLDPTKWFIKGLELRYIFRYWAIPGIAYHLYMVFWSGCVLFAWFHLIAQLRRSVGFRKNQLRYALAASLLGFLGGATNYPLWYRIKLLPLGTILVAAHIIILAYAIAKYRLMDIRVAITRAGIFVAVYVPILALPFFLSTIGQYPMIKLFGIYWWAGPLALMGLLGIVGPFIYIYLRRSAEAILFREQLHQQRLLGEAAEELTRVLNLSRSVRFVTHVLTKIARIKYSAIYLYNRQKEQFLLASSRNLDTAQPLVIERSCALVSCLQDKRLPLLAEELGKNVRQGSGFCAALKEIEDSLGALRAKVVVPGFLEEKLFLIVILGDKRSERIYSSEDLNSFSVLTNQAALAIENASVYSEIEEQMHQRTRELNELQKQLIQAEKLASVGILAGGVAHEINNPLAAILTNAQMLLAEKEGLNSDTRESLELIEEATKRCRSIVQKLMTYARRPLEATQLSQINLVDVLGNVVTFLDYQFKQDNISIKLETGSKQACWVTGNQNELEQVVTNLLLNARDAIKKIKNKGAVRVSLREAKQWVEFFVKDDGIGISPEVATKIFDPFFTTKDVGKGLGLGLSICQAIVDKHRGKISFRSQAGEGAEFLVQLPRQ